MLYDFKCPKCGTTHSDIVQDMTAEHVYTCPTCRVPCVRLFNSAPRISENAKGEWYSHTLGRMVKDHADFERGLEKLRYDNDLNKHLGNNASPKQQWVDEKMSGEERRERGQKEAEEQVAEEYSEYYDKVETFDPDKGVFGV